MDDDTSRAATWFARLDLGAKVVMAAFLGVVLGLAASLTLLYFLLVWLWGGEGSD